MIWNHLPLPTQVSVGELYIQGIERHSGEEPFSTGKAFGGPKSYDSTETVVLYKIYVLYSLYRLGGPVEGKLFLCASQDDGIWRDLLSTVCTESVMKTGAAKLR